MTINELFYICKHEIENGNGGKKIILCSDTGLDFFPLNNDFSHPTGNSDNIYECLDLLGLTEDEVLVLN